MLPEFVVFWTLVVLLINAFVLLMRARDEPKNRRFFQRITLLLVILVVLTYALHVTGVYP